VTSALILGDHGLVVRSFRCHQAAGRAQAQIESDGLPAVLVRRVCAWCQAEMGAVVGSPGQEDLVTHGMCPVCVERMEAELPGLPHNSLPVACDRLSCAVGSATAGRDRHFISPGATPGADVGAAVPAKTPPGAMPARVTGTSAPASRAAALEHLSGGPAATSVYFHCVTGLDFGRAIRWARERWRNPVAAQIRRKLHEIKEGR
jgi:hypothetical protein